VTKTAPFKSNTNASQQHSLSAQTSYLDQQLQQQRAGYAHREIHPELPGLTYASSSSSSEPATPMGRSTPSYLALPAPAAPAASWPRPQGVPPRATWPYLGQQLQQQRAGYAHMEIHPELPGLTWASSSSSSEPATPTGRSTPSLMAIVFSARISWNTHRSTASEPVRKLTRLHSLHTEKGY
jgi:hypothetical protein